LRSSSRIAPPSATSAARAASFSAWSAMLNVLVRFARASSNVSTNSSILNAAAWSADG
jgi:hypothetical protein